MRPFVFGPGPIVILLVTIFRLWAAAHLPLNNDEMYYWVWSRHPAYGYPDHPPMVAWLIGATSFLGKSPLAIRFASIVCLGVAAFVVRRTALTLGSSRLGADLAAIIFTLIPELEILMAQALPNPPYLLFWSLALLFAALASEKQNTRSALLLGFALAGATLSRTFGWALVAGIAGWSLTSNGKGLWPKLCIAFAVFALLYAPFVVWDATHHWWNLHFTLFGRQRPPVSVAHMESAHSIRFLIFAVLFIALTWLTARSGRMTLLAWTGLPLVLTLTALSFVQDVETYWLLGPFTSLCVALGPWLANQRRVLQTTILTIVITASLFTMGAMVYGSVTRAGPIYERDFVWMPAVRAIDKLRENGAVPVTDTYEVASILAFNDIPVLMFGYAPQTPQWQAWYGSQMPRRAVVITLRPLSEEPDSAAFVKASFSEETPGPILHIVASKTNDATFFTVFARAAPRFSAVKDR